MTTISKLVKTLNTIAYGGHEVVLVTPDGTYWLPKEVVQTVDVDTDKAITRVILQRVEDGLEF